MGKKSPLSLKMIVTILISILIGIDERFRTSIVKESRTREMENKIMTATINKLIEEDADNIKNRIK